MERKPWCTCAADPGGHCPLAPAWMCMACEKPLSSPLAVRWTFAVSPVRVTLTSPTPLTRFAGTGASSPLAAFPVGVAEALADGGVFVFPSPRRRAAATPAPTSSSRTAAAYSQRRLRRGWVVGGGDEPAAPTAASDPAL